jgi:hypothetical protein
VRTFGAGGEIVEKLEELEQHPGTDEDSPIDAAGAFYEVSRRTPVSSVHEFDLR